MPEQRVQHGQSRRDFFRYLMAAGAALTIGKARAGSSHPGQAPAATAPPFEYTFRTISIDRLREVRSWFEELLRGNRISGNETFRGYIDGFIYDPRAYLVGAKSLILFSIPERIKSILVHHHGNTYEILIPCGYTYTGLTGADIRKRIHADLIGDPAKQVRGRVRLPLKTLAVRSGLARYGKNNITYVEGYGSFHALYGLFTDKEMEDTWGPMEMLRLCKGCSVCTRECPTNCIRETDFIIDVGKCISLYNELSAAMPDWMDPKVHNALVGCLKCQFDCPANAEGIRHIERLAELTEEETDFILRQGEDKAVHQRIISKLSRFPVAQDLPFLSGMLRLVLANAKPVPEKPR